MWSYHNYFLTRYVEVVSLKQHAPRERKVAKLGIFDGITLKMKLSFLFSLPLNPVHTLTINNIFVVKSKNASKEIRKVIFFQNISGDFDTYKGW